MKQRHILGILTTVFAFAVLFLGSARSVSAQQVCSSNDSGLLGNANQYVFEGNQWNGSFSGTTQCETITNSTASPPSGPSMAYSGNAFDDTTGTPADYPNFLYGCFYGGCTENTQLPIQVSALSNWSITSGETVVEPSGDNNDVAYDIWFNTGPTTPTNQNTTGTELMIWVQHNGSAQPIGSPTATFTSSGYTWTVWTGTNTGNCGCSGTGSQVISFVNNGGDGPTGGTTYSLNLVPFFQEALSLGQIQSSWYLTTIQFGTEIWVGGPGIQVNNYWVNVAANSGGGGGSGGGSGSGGGNIGNGVYTLAPACATGSRLDDTGTVSNGSHLWIWTAGTGNANQEWTVTHQSGSQYTLGVDGTYCLDSGGTTAVGDPATVWACGSGNPNQEWTATAVTGGYTWTVQNSGLCLDVVAAGAANGTEVDQYSCNGTSAQTWALASVSGGGGGSIANGAYSLTPACATGSRLDDTGSSTTNGNKLEIWTASGAANQNWAFTATSANVYNIAVSLGPYCLDSGGATTPGSPVTIWTCNGPNENQDWTATAVSGGYTLKDGNAGLCLDVSGAGSANGTAVQTYTCNSTNAQTWSL